MKPQVILLSQEPRNDMPLPETATSRLEIMWGPVGLARLRDALVVVLGVGGVGSNCVEALMRGGIGRLVIVDGDEVAPSNINRQAIAFVDTVGRRKVDVMREFVEHINPCAQVTALDTFLRAKDVPAVLDDIVSTCGEPTCVIDAIDTVSAKLAVATWARDAHVPLISSMGGAMKLDPSQLRICDLFDTANDPLARVMRKECRKRGISRLTVLSSFEKPLTRRGIASGTKQAPQPPDSTESTEAAATGKHVDQRTSAPAKQPLGTASYLPPIMGQMIAGYVIRTIVEGTAAPMALETKCNPSTSSNQG